MVGMDRPPVLTTGPTNALGIVLMAHALERSAREAHAPPPGDVEAWPKEVPPAEALRRLHARLVGP